VPRCLAAYLGSRLPGALLPVGAVSFVVIELNLLRVARCLAPGDHGDAADGLWVGPATHFCASLTAVKEPQHTQHVSHCNHLTVAGLLHLLEALGAQRARYGKDKHNQNNGCQ
jgi:hypothetical protein